MKSTLENLQIYPISKHGNDWIEKLVLKSSLSVGFCPICGKLTAFLKFTDNLRESGQCSFCKSTNRQRQIGLVVLNAISETTKIKFHSLKEMALKAKQIPELSNLRIYNTETTGIVHHYLNNFPGYVASEYFGDNYASGDTINGKLHQDLTSTTFETSSIDLVISSDVFEHIPKPYKGFAEIKRILKSGGRHIFTVPFYSDRYKDEVRAILDEYGTLKHLLTPVYHGDPLRTEGILVYVIFSMEMLLKLDDLGYQVKMYDVRNPLKGILGTGAIVFDSIKNIG